MEKYFEEWNGKKFPVRVVAVSLEGCPNKVNVADIELYHEYEEEYEKGNKKAEQIDCSIFYFCDSGFIASDPTDDEIIEYLRKCTEID